MHVDWETRTMFGQSQADASWRKGWFVRPFCQLVIKAVRVDSPPQALDSEMLPKALSDARLRMGLNRDSLATRLNISLGTLNNWERRRTAPSRKFWPIIHALLAGPKPSFAPPFNETID